MSAVGFIFGFMLLSLISWIKQRQLMTRVGEGIAIGEARLAEMDPETVDAQALGERLRRARDAYEGRIPLDPESRRNVTRSLVPSALLIVGLGVLAMFIEGTPTTYMLLGLGAGTSAAKVLNRVRVLRWRPTQLGGAA